MFAVPGWAVSTSSLVQQTAKRKSRDERGAKEHSKKRKRDADDGADFPRRSSSDHSHAGNDGQRGRKVGGKSSMKKGGPVRHGKSQLREEVSEPDTRDKKSRGEQVKKRHQHAESAQSAGVKALPTVDELAPHPPTTTAKLTPLQAKMRSKLTSARFRHLNETLYTTSSDDALALFSRSPELFAEYHAGFSQQVKDSWPQNPVDGYIKVIKARGPLSEPVGGVLPLPRRKTGSCTIADLGCGDAPLARGCQANVKAFALKFHNYDLHSPNSFVTRADMSDLPLRDGEADIAVFCLSLMGTNWISFVEEAWRILRGDGKGEVWIAEVKSRFGRVTKGRVVDNSVGKRRKQPKSRVDDGKDAYNGPEKFAEDERTADQLDDETDVTGFVKVFTRRGFQLREGSVNKSNKMFASMVFTKSGMPTTGKHQGLKWNGKAYVKQQPQHDGKKKFIQKEKEDEDVSPEDEAKLLKPCVYKTR